VGRCSLLQLFLEFKCFIYGGTALVTRYLKHKASYKPKAGWSHTNAKLIKYQKAVKLDVCVLRTKIA
jgi:hypothetical protein